MAVVADTAAAVANTARSFITVVRNADMCPPETRAGGLPCLVSRACCRVALIPPSAADTVRQIKQVVSMSPGALCQGRRQRSPSMLRPTGVQGQPMVGVDGAGAKWSQSRSMFGALSRPALVLLAARRRRPGVTKPWRTESRYTVIKFVADPPRPPPGMPATQFAHRALHRRRGPDARTSPAAATDQTDPPPATPDTVRATCAPSAATPPAAGATSDTDAPAAIASQYGTRGGKAAYARKTSTCWPFRYSRTVRRLIPRCRAIADLVQPRAYSACASTVVSHVSIPTGSFDGSGGQRPRASREPTDIRWTPVGGSLKVGSFGEQVWADSDERHEWSGPRRLPRLRPLSGHGKPRRLPLRSPPRPPQSWLSRSTRGLVLVSWLKPPRRPLPTPLRRRQPGRLPK